MLGKIVLAVVVAAIVTLACFLVGKILQSINLLIAVNVGNFLENYGTVIGILAGLWYFFAGSLRR